MEAKYPNSTGIILAGGKSSRMGKEKGLMLHHGIPFVAHIIKALEAITNTIFVITNHSGYQQFGYPCIPDTITDCGPVGGIYTGLTHSKTENNMILSCDIPLITTSALRYLISHCDSGYSAVVYKDTPLIGWYQKALSEVFYKNIQEKQLRLQKLLLTQKVKTISIPDDFISCIKNINTPQQYKEATA